MAFRVFRGALWADKLPFHPLTRALGDRIHMMVSLVHFFLLSVCLTLCVGYETDPHPLAFHISGADVLGVNGLYVCHRPGSSCSRVGIQPTQSYVLSATNKMTSSGRQRRWYIAEQSRTGTETGHSSTPNKKINRDVQVYGAVETSKTPWRVHAWKRIARADGIDSTTPSAPSEETDLQVTPFSLRCDQQSQDPLTQFEMSLRLQASTALLSSSPGQAPSSEVRDIARIAGKTCVRALLQLPSLPQSGNDKSCTNELMAVSYKVLLVEGRDLSSPLDMLHICHWAAAAGSWTTAKRCYANNLDDAIVSTASSVKDSNGQFTKHLLDMIYAADSILRTYVRLVLALELNASEVQRTRTLRQSMIAPGVELIASKEISHWWFTIGHLGRLLSRGVVPVDPLPFAAPLCTSLRDIASAYGRKATAIVLTQMCFFAKNIQHDTKLQVPELSLSSDPFLIDEGNQQITYFTPIPTDQVASLVVK